MDVKLRLGESCGGRSGGRVTGLVGGRRDVTDGQQDEADGRQHVALVHGRANALLKTVAPKGAPRERRKSLKVGRRAHSNAGRSLSAGQR